MLRNILILSLVATFAFAGAVVGSKLLASATARAATTKGPSTTVLAQRIGHLRRRVRSLHSDLSKVQAKVTNLNSALSGVTTQVGGMRTELGYRGQYYDSTHTVWATVNNVDNRTRAICNAIHSNTDWSVSCY
jgi:hypothetical protein